MAAREVAGRARQHSPEEETCIRAWHVLLLCRVNPPLENQPKRIDLPDDYLGVKPKKILLLEDDEQFKEALKGFLESHFYDVVAVSNGVEGVREIMEHDFEIIVCDMMMPTLPGDMFYLAVERMRPHLCKRFIFITALKGDAKISAFIKQVNGTMLSKPFHVDDLLEVIAFTRSRAGIAAR
jgi:DNA-binding response OmpR family regulator